jgi:hypothetical protein
MCHSAVWYISAAWIFHFRLQLCDFSRASSQQLGHVHIKEGELLSVSASTSNQWSSSSKKAKISHAKRGEGAAELRLAD